MLSADQKGLRRARPVFRSGGGSAHRRHPSRLGRGASAGRDTRVRLEQILEQGMDSARGEQLLRALPISYEETRRLLEDVRLSIDLASTGE